MISLHEKFEVDLSEFSRLGGRVDEERRCDDSGEKYPVDFQYLAMNRWAFDRMRKLPYGPAHDFASHVDFVSYLASLRPVTHYDIREPDFSVPGLTYAYGDLFNLPVESNSVNLASCLHVAEHVGLGRYGDAIDPRGFERACAELTRILAPGGSLFFAVPIGQPRVVFNAHRVMPALAVLDAFNGLELREFSGISSQGKFVENAPADSLDYDTYGCGLFHFEKVAA